MKRRMVAGKGGRSSTGPGAHLGRGADVHAGGKGVSRHLDPGRGKNGRLGKMVPKSHVTPFDAERENFKRRPKAAEPDNVGRLMRPAAHNAKQAGVAKRARKTVKRLSNRVI